MIYAAPSYFVDLTALPLSFFVLKELRTLSETPSALLAFVGLSARMFTHVFFHVSFLNEAL
jgi:hypothetical protein